MKKLQPKKMVKVNCPNCGELMVKIYPWSSVGINPGAKIPVCMKCLNKAKKAEAR